MEFFIVTKTDCPYCVKAKELIKNIDGTYEETVVTTREELQSFRKDATTVPQIWKD